MAVAKLISSASEQVKARIAARDAEIAILEKNLQDLKDQKAAEEADLTELEMAVPEVKAVPVSEPI